MRRAGIEDSYTILWSPRCKPGLPCTAEMPRRCVSSSSVPSGCGLCEALRARLAQERGSSIPGSSALTAAELRVLPLLCTHLSFPEISQELFLSPLTVKSEMKAIYRKLGVSSRSQAVTRARELGLLEG